MKGEQTLTVNMQLRNNLELISQGELRADEVGAIKRRLSQEYGNSLEQQLVVLSHDLDVNIQDQAINFLLELNPYQYLDLALELMASENDDLKGSICYKLYADVVLDGRATQPLSKLLTPDNSPDVRWLAVAALGKTGDRNALPILQSVLLNDDGANYEGDLIRDIARVSISQILKRQSEE
jgi:HEAT repeat protein